MTEQRHCKRDIARRTLPTLSLAVILGLILTAAAFWWAQEAELDTCRLQFERDAAMRSSLIAQKMRDCLAHIKSLQRFLMGSEHVDRKNFTIFTSPFLEENNELYALGWIPCVASTERAFYEEKGRREGMPNFEINERDPNGNTIPVKDRVTYYPVFYVEPLKGSEKALGFDLGSDSLRRVALERARDTGEPTATGRIRLVMELEEQFGFLIFVPVYQKGMPTDTVEHRRVALEGFALGVFRAGNVLWAVLRSTLPLGLPFDLLDLSAPAETRLLHHWSPRLETNHTWKSSFFPVPPRYLDRFAFAGLEWGVEITASPAYMERHYSFAYWLTVPIGFLMTFLLSLYLRTILSQRGRLEHEVFERTKELKASEERLRLVLWAADLGTWDWSLKDGTVTRNERWAEVMGFSPGEIGPELLSWQEMVHPEDMPVVTAAWDAHMEGKSPYYQTEYRLLAKSGEWIWVFSRGKVTHRDEQDRPLRAAGTVRDVTEHKRIREAIRRESSFRDTIIQNLAEGLCVCHETAEYPHVKFTVWNSRMTRITGYTMEEIDRLGWYQTMYPDSELQAKAIERMRGMRQGTDLCAEEWEITRADGNKRVLAISTSIVEADDGLVHVLALMDDITERKLVEEALLESENKFKGFTEHALTGVYLIQDGVFTYVNPMFAQIFGYTVEECLDRMPFQTLVYPDGLGKVEEQVKKRIAGEVESVHYTFRGLKKDGQMIHVEIYGSAIVYQGRLAALGSILDITDRIRAEQELLEQYERQRVLLSTIPAYAYIKDTDSVYIVGNKRFSELSGVPEKEIPGKTDYDFFSKEDADRFRSDDAEIISSARAKLNYEVKGQDKQGNTIWYSTSKCPFYGPSGKIAGFVGICIDITDRKRAEEERRHFEQGLQQAQKAESLGRMAGAIAHHFNNMLGAVMGNLELVSHDLPQGSKLHNHLTQAMKASKRAVDVSHSMLTYLGQTISRKELIDLTGVVDDTLLLVGSSLPRNVDLEVHSSAEKITISADASHIRQILTNLILNAGEAIGELEGYIIVAIDQFAASDVRESRFFPFEWKPVAKRYACVTVTDTGCGMETAIQEKIFDPFFSTKFTGRGLGLPAALGLVKAHEGAIALESRPGWGSSFRLYLPVSELEAAPTGKEEVPPFEMTEWKGLVLLVEDEPMVRNMAQTMLERLGCEVITACDGFEAVEILRERKDELGLVLLDLSMPRMGGWETLPALRALRPDIPIILASGYDEAQVMQGEHSELPQAFLHKPYQIKDLKAALGAAFAADKPVS